MSLRPKTASPADPTAAGVRRAWSLCGMAAVGLLAGAWYLLGVRPAVLEVDSVRAQIGSQLDFLASEAALTEQHAGTIDAHEMLAAQAEQTRTRGQGPVDETHFLSWLADRAREENLKVRDFRPAGNVDYGDYRGQAIVLSAAGRYEAICRVLDALRRSPRMTHVTQLSVTPTDTRRRTYQVDVKLELLAHAPGPK